jgi:hypothetical protein
MASFIHITKHSRILFVLLCVAIIAGCASSLSHGNPSAVPEIMSGLFCLGRVLQINNRVILQNGMNREH